MEWKDIVHLKPDNVNENNRDAIFETLVVQEVEGADNKSFKRLYRISIKLLKWKGEQVRPRH